jgi:hypothetical protein
MVAATHLNQNPEVVFKIGIEKKGYTYCASINLNPSK